MDTRLLKDYLSRLWIHAVLVGCGYAVLVGMVARGESPLVYLWLAFAALGTFMWAFFMDQHLYRASRLVHTLPVSHLVVARTFCWEMVVVNSLAAWVVMLLELAVLWMVVPARVHLAEQFIPFALTCLLLNSSFFAFLALVRWNWGRWPVAAACSIGFVGFVVGAISLMLRWPESGAARAGLILGSAAGPILSFMCTDSLARPLLEMRTRTSVAASQPAPEHGPLSVPWWEGLLAQPLGKALCTSWLLLVLPLAGFSGLVAVLGKWAWWDRPWPLLLLALSTLASIAMFNVGSFLDSLRPLAALPLAGRRLAALVIVLPFLALAPLGFALSALLHLPLTVYYIGAAAWLITTAAALRWGRIGAVLAINLVGVMLNFWPLTRMMNRDLAPMIDLIGTSITGLLMLGASGWIWWHLRCRSEAYRYHLTRFVGGMCG